MPTGHWWTASGWEPQTQSSLKTDWLFCAGGQYEPKESQWHYYFLWGRRIVREADKTTTEKRRQMESVEQRHKEGRGKQRRMNAISSKGKKGRKILRETCLLYVPQRYESVWPQVWVTLCVTVYIHYNRKLWGREICSFSFFSLSFFMC